MRIELIIISVLLASCGDLSIPGLTPHKIEIRQGNLVTPEMREKLKVGMTRLQVRAAVGTPLVSDPFHVNRWDYVYRFEQKGKVVEQQRLTLYFENDRLARIDDSNMPASSTPPAQTPQPVVAASVVADAVPARIEVAPPVPAVKPEPAPEVKPLAASAGEQAVGDAVKAWSEAWAVRDVAKYLSSYAGDFKPADGMSHAAWEAQRKERIGKAKNIKVELSEIKVNMQGESRASVFFKQSYSADNHKDVVRKIMGLE
ncbi:MAG: outer membrane protein assembly factor BamE, partial [Gallionellaceae bacterium]|nr:outer membrane protein assembly factor BamE [Gallionellaceae bacterium]